MVALTTAGAGVLASSFAPIEYRGLATVAAASVTAAIVAVIATRTYVIRRLLGVMRKTSRQLAHTQSMWEDEQAERAALRDFGRMIDAAKDEKAVLSVAETALRRCLAPHSTEVHLVDRVDPILALALATGPRPPLPDCRPSPWDPLACRTSSTLVYESTDGPEVCAHLAGRLSETASAVAVPLAVTDGLLGVLYTFGPNGKRPGRSDVAYIQDFATALAGRLAVIRSIAEEPHDDRIDRLTGLPGRSTTQRRLLAMIDDRRSFTVAIADVDDFGRINDIGDRDTGDRTLEILAGTGRKTVRPIDVVGRIGGDELLFIFPDTTPDDAVKALERPREALFLAQSAASSASFTLSVGVISSSSGGPIEQILLHAAEALRYAKSEGGNRVVLAPAVESTPSA